MDINVEPGLYVVAVSGGVDSMALLDILRLTAGTELIVAHYDHGIRADSLLDRQLVQEYAKEHDLKFVYDEGNLGPDTSEATARKARYEFLHKLRKVSGSRAVITAHHQDDLVETVVINLLRGTGRSGISSLDSKASILRPALHINKNELIEYARANNTTWREDSTNSDTKYLRNYIRHKIIPKLTEDQKSELILHINNTKQKNSLIDETITSLLHVQPGIDTLDRHWFTMLPHSVATEVMSAWLKRHKIKDVDRKSIGRLVNISKSAQPNRVADLDKDNILKTTSKQLIIAQRNR